MGSLLSSLIGGGETAEAAAASSSEGSRVLSFHSSARWQLHFNNSKDSSQLVLYLFFSLYPLLCFIRVLIHSFFFFFFGVKMVIDFAASWCGPCKFMEPAVQAMASKFTEVEFAKIDVDELAVCTFFFFFIFFIVSNLFAINYSLHNFLSV